jgi:DNA-binding response OmpR family regulator
MREPLEPREDEPSPLTTSVLVVIANPHVRRMVVWALDELGMDHVYQPNWRRAVRTTDARPALAIGHLDDVGKNVLGVRALLRASWGEPVPFILLSHRRAIAHVAAECGAAAGLRKPLVVGLLLATVRRILPTHAVDFPK